MAPLTSSLGCFFRLSTGLSNCTGRNSFLSATGLAPALAGLQTGGIGSSLFDDCLVRSGLGCFAAGNCPGDHTPGQWKCALEKSLRIMSTCDIATIVSWHTCLSCLSSGSIMRYVLRYIICVCIFILFFFLCITLCGETAPISPLSDASSSSEISPASVASSSSSSSSEYYILLRDWCHEYRSCGLTG